MGEGRYLLSVRIAYTLQPWCCRCTKAVGVPHPGAEPHS